MDPLDLAKSAVSSFLLLFQELFEFLVEFEVLLCQFLPFGLVDKLFLYGLLFKSLVFFLLDLDLFLDPLEVLIHGFLWTHFAFPP